MSDIAIEFNHVWKKFKRGEKYDSLRDLIPAMVKRVFSRNSKERELQEKEFWALKDVSFEVKRGEVLGIIGPNGAGKSTILKVISKILKPNRGFVKTRGRICTLIEIGAGFHPDLTGRENIYLNGAILGMKKKEIDRKFEEIVEFSGIKDFIDTPIKRYSSGMAARLGFAVAAHLDPEILLVDEVLSVGDAPFRAKCIRRMSKLMRGNVAVVFVSHNMEFIRQLCSKCLVLSQGKMVFWGETNKAIEKYLEIIQNIDNINENDDKIDDKKGRILHFEIKNKNRVKTNQIVSGEEVYFNIEYELKTEVKDLSIEIGFSTPTGLWIATCNNTRDGYKLPNTIGKHKIVLKIISLNLAPGDYDISIGLKEAYNFKNIDVHLHRYKLFVEADKEIDLLVNFIHTWQIIS